MTEQSDRSNEIKELYESTFRTKYIRLASLEILRELEKVLSDSEGDPDELIETYEKLQGLGETLKRLGVEEYMHGWPEDEELETDIVKRAEFVGGLLMAYTGREGISPADARQIALDSDLPGWDFVREILLDQPVEDGILDRAGQRFNSMLNMEIVLRKAYTLLGVEPERRIFS